MYSEPLKHEFQSCEGLVDGFCSFIQNPLSVLCCPYGVRWRPSTVSAAESSRPTSNSYVSCSEFQNPSQTAAEQGEAKLRTLNFKTTWSEF